MEDDEMEMSDEDRGSHHGSSAKRMRYDAESLKEENDSLRCQLEAIRNEMSHERSDIKYDSDYREKQIKVLQETIRNMQTQLLRTKTREQKDTKTIHDLERKLKEANVKQLLLNTRIQKNNYRRRERRTSSTDSDKSDRFREKRKYSTDTDDDDDVEVVKINDNNDKAGKSDGNNVQVIDIDDDVNIIEDQTDIVEIHDEEDEEDKNDTKEQTSRDGRVVEGDKNEKDDKKDQANGQTIANEAEKEKLCEDEQNQEIDQITTNEETEAKPAEEKTAKANLSDKDAGMAEVETKLAEETKAVEPKILPFIEAKIIALTAAYLIVQPFGIKTDSICAYLRQSVDTLDIQTTTLQQILGTYTNLFKLENDTDANETKALWKFCGFTTSNGDKDDKLIEANKTKVNKNEETK